MKKDLYVEDIIVPLIAIHRGDKNKFRFLGTGYYFDKKGHLVTCRHVIDAVKDNESLCVYQIGKKTELELKIIKISDKYDLALCKSIPSGLEEPWPFIDKPFVDIGSDIELYGYVYEPLGPDELPFRQRYMKGYITGISRESNYPDSYELNFPVLFGMSGSPLVCHLQVEGSDRKQTCIVGCAYGSRESEVVHHKIVSSEHYEERVSRIVELGLSYIPKAVLSIFEGVEIDINTY